MKRKRLSAQSVLVMVPKPTSSENKQATVTLTTQKLSIKSETDCISELPDEKPTSPENKQAIIALTTEKLSIKVQCLPEQITTFSKVKQLEFYFPLIKFNLLKIIAILKACPLLEKFHIITTFSKVKQLEFYFPLKIKFNLLKISVIIKACPLLEKFHIVMVSDDIEGGTPLPVSFDAKPISLDRVHKYLKEVYIGGFKSIAGYIELAIYLLEYGVALERMVVDPKLKSRFEGGNRFFNLRQGSQNR